MLDTKKIDELAAHPLTARRMYVACDCNAVKGCVGGHTSAALSGKPTKVCPECGDTGEAHYLMVPVTSDSWTSFYGARRGHDDDDPAARASGEICEGAPPVAPPVAASAPPVAASAPPDADDVLEGKEEQP